MTTAKEMVDKIIENYENMKPYALFCNPSKENEIKKCVNGLVQVIPNCAVEEDKVYLIKKSDLVMPLVFGKEEVET